MLCKESNDKIDELNEKTDKLNEKEIKPTISVIDEATKEIYRIENRLKNLTDNEYNRNKFSSPFCIFIITY